MAKVSENRGDSETFGGPAQTAKQVDILRFGIGRLGCDRHEADCPEARGKALEACRGAAPFVPAPRALEVAETALDAVEKGFTQLRNQLGLVAHRCRQSRIDCTRIIGHACISTGKRLKEGFAIRFPKAEIMVNS